MKSVIITGASSGIGLATAKKFHKENYFVFLLARSADKLTALAKELPNSLAIPCDLSQFSQIDSAVEIIKKSSHSVEILVNNAGIFDRKSFLETEMSDWEKMFQVNFFAPIYLTKKILPLLEKNNKACITMVSSTLGIKTSANTAAYSASKAALNSLAQTLALELATSQIRCNVIAPGIVETPIHGFDRISPDKKKETLEFYNKLQPLGRVGTPEELAESLFFISSEQSRWTTGAINIIDGGINLL